MATSLKVNSSLNRKTLSERSESKGWSVAGDSATFYSMPLAPPSLPAATPRIVLVSRVLFFLYFIVGFYLSTGPAVDSRELPLAWMVYQLIIYGIAEKFYAVFRAKNIDASYAFPLMFAVYVIGLVTIVLGGQDRLPLLNRAEHLTAFVLITYIIWTFFIRYLPHDVWSQHPYYTSLLVFSVGSAFSVGNEIVELALDSIFSTQLIGRDYDTALDLLMNVLGSILFLAVRLILGSAEPTKRLIQ